MITATIISLVLGAVTAPLRAFADVSLSADITNAVVYAGQVLSSVSTFLPISTLLAVFSLVLVVELAITTYKLIRWIYRKIPGIS